MVEEVGIDVVLDSRPAEAGADRVDGALAKLERRNIRVQRSVDRLQSAYRTATRLIGVGIAGIGARKLLDVADNYKLINARVEGLISETSNLNEVQQLLFDTAQTTGSALEDSLNVFQRLSFARSELDATDAELLKLTGTVQKLGAISGASGEALRAGLTQFGQAMSSGIVRAEEFNSLLENIPAVALEIADAMGTTPGKLRAAVVEGKVLSKDVFDALLSRSEEVNDRFERLPLTIDRGFGQLQNSLTRVLGLLDNTIDATSGVAQLFSITSQLLDEVIELDNEQSAIDEEEGLVAWAKGGAIALAVLADTADTARLLVDKLFSLSPDEGSFLSDPFSYGQQLGTVVREFLGLGEVANEALNVVAQKAQESGLVSNRFQTALERVFAEMEERARSSGQELSKTGEEIKKVLGEDGDDKSAKAFQRQSEAIRENIVLKREELKLGRDLTSVEEFRLLRANDLTGDLTVKQADYLEQLNAELSILEEQERIANERKDRLEEIERLIAAGDSEADRADRRLSTGTEIVQEAFEEGDFGDDPIEAKRRRDAAIEELERQHQETMAEIRREKQEEQQAAEEAAREKRLDLLAEETGLTRRTVEQLADFETATQKEKFDTVIGLGAQFLNLLGTQSEKAFKVAKAFAIGDALINAYNAANKAMASLPYPANIAAAALTLAKGLANVQAIRKAQPGGSPGGGASGGAGGAGGAAGNEAAGTLPNQPLGDLLGDRQRQRVTINVNGKSFDDDQVRDLVKAINESVRDGLILETN